MRNIIVVIIIIIALAGIYYGAYRPFAKAQLYVAVRGAAPTFRTLDEFTLYHDRMFNYYSPIGNRETVKFFIENMLGVIAQENQPEEVARAVVEYGESYIYKNETIHLLQMAYQYDTLWRRFRDKEYFEKAEFYYNRVHEIGPRLPHALYGLLSLYQRDGNVDKMKEIGEKILELWPSDERVTEVLDSI